MFCFVDNSSKRSFWISDKSVMSREEKDVEVYYLTINKWRYSKLWRDRGSGPTARALARRNARQDDTPEEPGSVAASVSALGTRQGRRRAKWAATVVHKAIDEKKTFKIVFPSPGWVRVSHFSSRQRWGWGRNQSHLLKTLIAVIQYIHVIWINKYNHLKLKKAIYYNFPQERGSGLKITTSGTSTESLARHFLHIGYSAI